MDSPRSLKINSQPLYLQAIDAIKTLIEQKVYEPGDMLPPEDSLARDLGISRLTLREALGYLENDGFIERKRGVGTFVRELSPTHFAGGLERLETLRSLARVAGLDAQTMARDISMVPADAEWAARLEVPTGTELARVQVTQVIRGRTTAYFDSLTAASGVDPADLAASDGSLLEHFLERATPALSYSRSLIYAVSAHRSVAEILGIPEGLAVLRLSETYYLANRRPIVLSENYFLTDCFNFYISRRAAGRFSRH